MTLISTITKEETSNEQEILFEKIEKDMGMVPNLLRVLANSPVALRAFLGLYGITNNGQLNAQTRERIALVVSQQNGCEYCVANHLREGTKIGLSDEEMRVNRAGNSQDQKAAVAMQLTRALIDSRGDVTEAELTEARKAGYNDGEIVEIIMHVGMNMLANMIAKSARIGLDTDEVTTG